MARTMNNTTTTTTIKNSNSIAPKRKKPCTKISLNAILIIALFQAIAFQGYNYYWHASAMTTMTTMTTTTTTTNDKELGMGSNKQRLKPPNPASTRRSRKSKSKSKERIGRRAKLKESMGNDIRELMERERAKKAANSSIIVQQQLKHRLNKTRTAAGTIQSGTTTIFLGHKDVLQSILPTNSTQQQQQQPQQQEQPKQTNIIQTKGNYLIDKIGSDIPKDVRDMIHKIHERSVANPYSPFEPFQIIDRSEQQEQKQHQRYQEDMGVTETIRKLRDMGVDASEFEDPDIIQNLPPWSQIMENIGTTPIVLGMERCQAFRDAVPAGTRHVAPAGLFSTGTNILDKLLRTNCLFPKAEKRFHLWQTPWGKHNPESSKGQHAAAAHNLIRINQTAVLPIVMVRHPYTWLYALCKHSYALNWGHNPNRCDDALGLTQSVHAAWGAKKVNGRPASVQYDYDSLLHVWKDWNLEYFEQSQYPLLMARLEDIVYRPQEVVSQICDCAGGKLTHKFRYEQDSANYGNGHGEHRSDLLTAFIKFGKPLQDFETKYFSKTDWEIIRKVLDHEDHGMMQALGYK